ncbi:MAG: fibronectin type III domain-containing protein [Candidatus Diapherotrites archaeon]|nr:fibronectin type III domain-containing protein [Candidatus Diapherotrites archaeon]
MQKADMILVLLLFVILTIFIMNAAAMSAGAGASANTPIPNGDSDTEVIVIKDVWFKCVPRGRLRDKIKILAEVESTEHNIKGCRITVPEAGIRNKRMGVEHVESGKKKTFKKKFRIPDENIIHVKIKCHDKGDNEATAEEEFDISECKESDEKAPETIITPEKKFFEEWHQGPVVVHLKCYDSGSGCKSIHYVLISTPVFETLQSIIQTIEEKLKNSHRTKLDVKVEHLAALFYRSEDKAGNREPIQRVIVRIDNKAPETTYNGPEGTVFDEACISFSCKDRPKYNSGCSVTKYSINNGPWQEFSDEIEIAEEGCYSIKYYSIDNAGNEEEVRERYFCIEGVQEEQPLEITSGPNADVKGFDTVEITWTTSRGASSFVYYSKTQSLENAAYGEAGITHAVLLQGLEAGTTYYYKVFSSTEDGKTAESDIYTFTTDEKPAEELEIKNLSVIASDTYAEISWETNIKATCELYFWESAEEAESIRVSEDAVMHSVAVEGLEENTSYGFKILCYKEFLSVSEHGSFTTLSSEKAKETGSEIIEVGQPFYPEEESEQWFEGEEEPAKTAEPRIEEIKVTPQTKVQYEGDAFKFELALDYSKTTFEYEWDYGDGTKLEITSDPIAYHTYYIDEDVPKKEYTLRVTVRDKSSGAVYGKAETTVIVKRAVFKAKLIEPSPGTLLSKDEKIRFKIAFLDANNNIIDAHNIPYHALYINGLPIWAEFVGNWLVITYEPKLKVDNYELIAIKASGNIAGRTVEITSYLPINFKPLPISLSHNPFTNRKYYMGSRLSLYRVEFVLGQKALPTKMLYLIGYLEGKHYRKRINITLAGYPAFLNINHIVTEEDIENGLALRLEGRDIYGNVLNTKIKIPLSKNNPEFDLIVIGPKRKVFVEGEIVTIVSKIESTKGLRGDVSVKCDGFGGMALYDEKSDTYSFSFTVPENYNKTSVECEVRAKTRYKDEEPEDIERVTLLIGSGIIAEFIIPKEGINIASRPIDHMEVDVRYPDNTRPSAEKLAGWLYIDENGFAITLEKKGNLYVAELAKPIDFGEHVIKLTVERPFQFEKYIYVKLVSGLGASEIALILLAIASAAFVLCYILKSTLEKKKVRKELELEASKLQALMRKLKREYFKRHIGEAEFKERYGEARKRLRQIKRLLRKGKRGWGKGR